MDRYFRTYTIARVSDVDTKEIDRLLYPLLKADDRPQVAAMLSAATPLLTGVLDHKHEEPYLAAMATGNYRPELLFPKHTDIVERIRLHPHSYGKPRTLPNSSPVGRNLRKLSLFVQGRAGPGSPAAISVRTLQSMIFPCTPSLPRGIVKQPREESTVSAE
jgi:hypothetical protein